MLFPFADFEFRIDFVMLVFDLSWRFEGRLQDCKEIWPGWLIFRTEGGHILSEAEHEFSRLDGGLVLGGGGLYSSDLNVKAALLRLITLELFSIKRASSLKDSNYC